MQIKSILTHIQQKTEKHFVREKFSFLCYACLIIIKNSYVKKTKKQETLTQKFLVFNKLLKVLKAIFFI